MPHIHTTFFQYVTDGFFLRERNNHDNNNNNNNEIEEETKTQSVIAKAKNHYLTHTKFF